MAEITSAGLSDVGRKRKANEDSFIADDELGLYVVADGMGGHKAGEVASRIVVDTVRGYVRGFADHPAAEKFPIAHADHSRDANRLLSAIHLANRRVYRSSVEKEAYRGMGSTVAAVYFVESTLIAANVGDSPIYLARGGAIVPLYKPHTLLAEHASLAPPGSKPPGKKFAHVLTRAMGAREQVRPDALEQRCLKDDIVVLCSDGLTDKVTPEEILRVVSARPPGKACRVLVELANRRGGDDNVTVLVLQVVGVPAPAPHNRAQGKAAEALSGPARSSGPVALEYDTDDASYSTEVTDIGTEGVFIATMEAFSMGQQITLYVTLGPHAGSLTLTGTVVDRTPKGIQVRFDELNDKQRKELESLASFTGKEKLDGMG